ncbi:phosphopantetheine-binding protein [Desulfonatronospira thiodismutans ASO3-1]|uniref:Acyl carrier protein n=1 Tax=Desulfonatronospira thiodismutans ASO3-1 TaxID=555779 RepID=D6SS11_9BACT|nr:acyl carrier protein [Desulfonatronospira thiodismutans]EFI33477.1 phosphopantetheine-binding protein [Desulfonatronospira thiodismutans ASO3-1]
MTQQQIIETVNRALSEEFELEPADMSPEAHLYNDLGLDSLDAVDMVIVLENAFGCKLRDEKAIQNIRTMGDLYAFIEEKKKELE